MVLRGFGIDPGSRFTGWGVIENKGSTYRMIECGVVTLGGTQPLSDRLGTLYKELDRLLAHYAPDAVFLESIFHHKSARSALVLGHARGVAMLACGLHQAPLLELSPSEVKKAVTGRGRADKAQVQAMVRVLLGLVEAAPEDASDALAVAFAGLARTRFSAAVASAARAGDWTKKKRFR